MFLVKSPSRKIERDNQDAVEWAFDTQEQREGKQTKGKRKLSEKKNRKEGSKLKQAIDCKSNRIRNKFEQFESLKCK